MFITVLTYLVIGLLAVFGLFYIVLEVRFFRALGTVRTGTSDVEPKPHVSILISARNESAGIRDTLDSVLAQDYEGEWDVWVADDRSTDDTPEILAEYATRDPRLHVLTIEEIPEGVSPKKHALSRLIEACDGEVLCLTDADCIVQPSWIRESWRNSNRASNSWQGIPTSRPPPASRASSFACRPSKRSFTEWQAPQG